MNYLVYSSGRFVGFCRSQKSLLCLLSNYYLCSDTISVITLRTKNKMKANKTFLEQYAQVNEISLESAKYEIKLELTKLILQDLKKENLCHTCDMLVYYLSDNSNLKKLYQCGKLGDYSITLPKKIVTIKIHE